MSARSFTFKQFHQAFEDCKDTKFSKISVDQLKDTLMCIFKIDERHTQTVKNAAKTFVKKREVYLKKYGTCSPAAEGIQNEVLLQLDDVEEEVESEEEANENEVENQGKCYRVSLLDVKYKAKYNRTKNIIAFLNDEAAKNKVNINQLLGIIIKQVNCLDDYWKPSFLLSNK